MTVVGNGTASPACRSPEPAATSGSTNCMRRAPHLGFQYPDALGREAAVDDHAQPRVGGAVEPHDRVGEVGPVVFVQDVGGVGVLDRTRHERAHRLG